MAAHHVDRDPGNRATRHRHARWAARQLATLDDSVDADRVRRRWSFSHPSRMATPRRHRGTRRPDMLANVTRPPATSCACGSPPPRRRPPPTPISLLVARGGDSPRLRPPGQEDDRRTSDRRTRGEHGESSRGADVDERRVRAPDYAQHVHESTSSTRSSPVSGPAPSCCAPSAPGVQLIRARSPSAGTNRAST